MDYKKLVISALNKSLNQIASAKNTYKATKLNYLKNTGQVMSKKLFQYGLTENLLQSGSSFQKASLVAKNTVEHMKVDIRAMKKVRKDIAVKGGSVTFRKIRGRIVPVRMK